MPDEASTERKLRSWAQVLAGIQPKEIGAALQRLPEHVPSAPQFRALCKQDAPACAAHRPFPKALPKPKPDIHKGLAALAVIKHNLRGGNQEIVKPEKKYIPADEFAFGRQADYEERKKKREQGEIV